MPLPSKADFPVQGLMSIIGGRWKCVIIYKLLERMHRYGELRRELAPISEKMLMQQLRELETDGIVHRKVFQEIPPRVEYSLTRHGLTLKSVLDPLCEWSRKHMARRELEQRSKQKDKLF